MGKKLHSRSLIWMWTGNKYFTGVQEEIIRKSLKTVTYELNTAI